jgi:hypothetical protein
MVQEEERNEGLLLAIRYTNLFPNPLPFWKPTHGCILVTISLKTLLEKADCQNDREWHNELNK